MCTKMELFERRCVQKWSYFEERCSQRCILEVHEKQSILRKDMEKMGFLNAFERYGRNGVKGKRGQTDTTKTEHFK